MENILDSSDFDSTIKNMKRDTDTDLSSEAEEKPSTKPSSNQFTPIEHYKTNKRSKSRKELEEEEREKMQ
jgi:hypothetical protein